MNNIKLKYLVSVIIFSVFFSCNKEEVEELPQTYPMKELSLYPEGVVYSQLTEKTYVGSYYKGKILTVDLSGNMVDFIIDKSLVAVVGMAIDEKNNRLLVCNSDAGISLRSDMSTIGQLAEVIVYDLITGEKLKTIDLRGLVQGGHFLNDLVIDNNGVIYITDSFSPAIYRIDKDYKPSVFVTDSIFNVPQGTFGLNGIVFHEDGYLIVGKSFGGVLYKVSLNNPSDIREITLNMAVNSLDGLLLDGDDLFLVSNYFAGPAFDEAIYKIETSDNWKSGIVTNSFTDLDGSYPTTLTKINNGLFVNFGYFTELVNPNSLPNSNFKLQKILFTN